MAKWFWSSLLLLLCTGGAVTISLQLEQTTRSKRGKRSFFGNIGKIVGKGIQYGFSALALVQMGKEVLPDSWFGKNNPLPTQQALVPVEMARQGGMFTPIVVTTSKLESVNHWIADNWLILFLLVFVVNSFLYLLWQRPSTRPSAPIVLMDNAASVGSFGRPFSRRQRRLMKRQRLSTKRRSKGKHKRK